MFIIRTMCYHYRHHHQYQLVRVGRCMMYLVDLILLFRIKGCQDLGLLLQNSNTYVLHVLFTINTFIFIFWVFLETQNLPDTLDLPLMQAPVRGLHWTPGGQCSQPVTNTGSLAEKGKNCDANEVKTEETNLRRDKTQLQSSQTRLPRQSSFLWHWHTGK